MIAEDDDVRERVVRLYVSLVPGGRAPREGERGELDSLAFLEFVELVEREFAIAIETRELDESNFATTAAVVAFVRGKLRRAAAA